MRAAVAFVCAWGCLACAGSTPNPYFDDARFLRFGVDPFEEADALEHQFEEAGHRIALRLRGQHFSAFGTVDRQGKPLAVRVVTLRGVTLALNNEEGDALHEAVGYRLLPAPNPDSHDFDADGFEEVLVEQQRGAAAHGCIELYRVRDVGFVDRVALPERALGEAACVEAARDVDADGRVELVLVARLVSLGRAGSRAPEVPLVLWSVDHRFEVRPPEGAFVAELRASRGDALALARARGDADSVYRLALELSLLAALGGADSAARRALFDQQLGDALAGSDSVTRARAMLQAELPALAEWPEPSDAPEPADSPASP